MRFADTKARAWRRPWHYSWEASVSQVREIYGQVMDSSAALGNNPNSCRFHERQPCRVLRVPGVFAGGVLSRDLRVALVHDWLTGMRGGEKVLERPVRAVPAAEVLTLVPCAGHGVARRSNSGARERRLCRDSPGVHAVLPALPAPVPARRRTVRPRSVRPGHQHQPLRRQVGDPDRAGTPPLLLPHAHALRVGPVRTAYFGVERLGRLPSACLSPVLTALARWDAVTAGRVDRFVANSEHVARRIREYYNRSASVIYPPVDTRFLSTRCDDISRPCAC